MTLSDGPVTDSEAERMAQALAAGIDGMFWGDVSDQHRHELIVVARAAITDFLARRKESK